MSPEETGRSAKIPDHRSDLYSLGALLYELISGKKVFEEEDETKLVYSILTKQPLPFSSHSIQVFAPIEQLIMKLLRKDANERYQTIDAVEFDLNLCIQLIEFGCIDKVDLNLIGSFDQYRQMKFSSKLYGRKVQQEQINQLISKVFIKNEKQIAFITGQIGSGK